MPLQVSKEVATLSLSEEKSTDAEKTEPPVEASDSNKSAESVKEETMEEEEVIPSTYPTLKFKIQVNL